MPCWMYGPKGEAQIFASPDDAPKSWKDTPPTNVEGGTEEARRQLDIPPGRMDRQALPPTIAVIADQIFTEVTARIGAPPTPDERPVALAYNPLDHIERIGERPLTAAEPEAVVDQGDKQPHLEVHNFRVSDALRTAARVESERAKAEAQAAANQRAGEITAQADAVTRELGDDPPVSSLVADGRLPQEKLQEAVEPSDVAAAAREAASKEPPKPGSGKSRKG